MFAWRPLNRCFGRVRRRRRAFFRSKWIGRKLYVFVLASIFIRRLTPIGRMMLQCPASEVRSVRPANAANFRIGTLASDAGGERAELAAIYVGRGLEPELANTVALQLMAHDALGAHARDELGLTNELRARPVQAALASAASFSAGGLMPVLIAAFTPAAAIMPAVAVTSLLFLALLGAASARVGGARLLPAALRVAFWGALAMGVTTGVGALFGSVV
jgi:VIT1/CCC1 family predicted Fe2+/Mn2+ transporter